MNWQVSYKDREQKQNKTNNGSMNGCRRSSEEGSEKQDVLSRGNRICKGRDVESTWCIWELQVAGNTGRHLVETLWICQ